MRYYFEGAEILAPFTIMSNEPMFDIDTVSLKKLRATQNAQRWELSFEVLNADNPTDLLLSSLVNSDQVSTMIMPQFKEVYDATTCSNSPRVLTAASAGAGTIVVDKASASGLLPKGSFVKFSNHDKLYILTENLNMSSGTTRAKIYPALTRSVGINTSLNFLENCEISYFRDISDLKGITFSDGILSNIGTVNLVEAL